MHQMKVREGRSQALQLAIRKYGAENFAVETLVIADDWEYLCDLERKAIQAYGTMAPGGYNLTVGGEGVVGRIHTEHAAANMSAGQKRRHARPEERERLRAAGKKGTQVQIAKCAALRIDGLPKWERDAREKRLRLGSDEHRQMLSEQTKAAMARPEVAAKMKACAQARAANPEWRAKISASKKGQGAGRVLPEETKAKMAEARRQWWARKHATKGT